MENLHDPALNHTFTTSPESVYLLPTRLRNACSSGTDRPNILEIREAIFGKKNSDTNPASANTPNLYKRMHQH
jgi:hypothetical protein